MAANDYLIEILVELRDNATRKLGELQAQVEALKASAAGSNIGRDLTRGLGDIGNSAGGAADDTSRLRKEHDTLRREAPQTTRAVRDVEQAHADASAAASDSAGAHAGLADSTKGAQKSIADLHAEVRRGERIIGDHTRALGENAKAEDSVKLRAAELESTQRSLYQRFQSGQTVVADFASQLRRLQQELQRTARSTPLGSSLGDQLARQARQVAQDAQRFGSQAIGQDTLRRYREFTAAQREGGVATREARAAYADFHGELRSAINSLPAGTRGIGDLAKAAEQAGRRAVDAGVGFGTMARSLRSGDIRGAGGFLDQLAQKTDAVGLRIVSLSAKMRGAVLALGVGLFQQLDSGALALLGTLTSLASAAAEAGAAIGGALVSGLAQAVPATTILIGALQRVRAVLQAVKLASTVQQQQFTDPTQAAQTALQISQQLSSAQNALADAYQQVADAQTRVRDSQIALTQARLAAIRNITDLTLAEKEAQLQAQGARLSLAQAQQQLQQQQLGGTALGLAQAQLAVQEAQLGVKRSDINVPRARADAQRAQNAGVEGALSVSSARQSVAQSELALTRARQAIPQAQGQLRLAELRAAAPRATQTSAQSQLSYALSQLSGPERQLYSSLVDIQKQIENPNGPLRGITDAIVRPFANAVGRIDRLLHDPKFLGAIQPLADAMGRGLSEILGKLSGPQGTSFFKQMADDAAKNTPLIAGAITHLIGIFESIAKAGAPTLHAFLGDLDRLARRLDLRASSSQGQQQLQNLFSTGRRYAEEIGHLLGSVIRLVLALGGDAAPSGEKAIDSMTAAIKRATDWVNAHGPEVRNFFDQARQGAGLLIGVLITIGRDLIEVFSLDSLRTFTSLLQDLVLPALRTMANVFGFVTRVALGFFDLPVIRQFTELIIGATGAFILLGKVITPAIGVWTRFGALLTAVKAGLSGFGGGGGFSGGVGAFRESLKSSTAQMAAAGKEISTAATRMQVAADTFAGSVDKLAGTTGTQEAVANEQITAADRQAAAAAEQATAAAEEQAAAAERAAAVAAGAGGAAAGAAGAAGAEGAVGGAAAAGAEGAAGGTLLSRLGGAARTFGLGGAARMLGGRVIGSAALLYGLDQVLPAGVPKSQGIPTTGSAFQRDITQYRNELGDIKHVDPGGFIKDFFGGSTPDKAQRDLAHLGDQIKNVGNGLANLSPSSLQRIHDEAVRLGQDPSLAKFHGALVNLANETTPAGIQAKRFFDAIGKGGVQAYQQWQQSFNGISAVTGNVFSQVSQTVTQNLANINTNLGTGTTQGATALVSTIAGAVSSVLTNTTAAARGVHGAMDAINKMLARALRSLGVNVKSSDLSTIPLQDVLSLAQGAVTGGTGSSSAGGLSAQGGSGHGAGFARGGMVDATPGGRVIRVGEGGHDEFVLTTDPRHAPRQRALLGDFMSRSPHMAAGGSVYQYPMGPGLTLGRTDQGVDWAGSGNIVAIGRARLTRVSPQNSGTGWPGASGAGTGAMIVYQLLDGPDSGRYVYLAENVDPTPGLAAGKTIPKGAVIAHARGAYPFLEAGWAANASGQVLTPYTSATREKATPGGTAFGQFVAGLQHGVITGGANIAAVQKLTAPKVKGVSGTLGTVAQASVNRVTDAANRYIAHISGQLGLTAGPGGNTTAQSVATSGSPAVARGWTDQAMRIARVSGALWRNMLLRQESRESNYDPNSVNTTDINAQHGDPSKGILQTTGSTFRQFSIAGHKNILNPIDNIVAAIRYIIATYGGGDAARAAQVMWARGGGAYAGGGELAPWGGRPVAITAHEGEWVVNPMQQGGIARLAGTTVGRLRSYLGFDRGQPRQSFQQGGAPVVAYQTAQPTTGTALFGSHPAASATTFPDLTSLDTSSIGTIAQVFRAVQRGFRALSNITARSKNFSDFEAFANALADQTIGIVAQLQTAFQTLQTRSGARAALSGYQVTSRGVVLRPGGQQTIDTANIGALDEQRESLQGQSQIVNTALAQVRRRIGQANRIRDVSLRKKELASLQQTYNNLIAAQTSLLDSMSQNVSSAYQAQQQNLQDQLTRITDAYGEITARLQVQQTGAQATGQLGLLPQIDKQIADAATAQIAKLQRVIWQSAAIGDQATVAQLQQQVASLQQTAIQAAAQMITDAISAVQQRQQVSQSYAGMYQTLAQVALARGDIPGAGALNAQAYRRNIDSDRASLDIYRGLRNQAREQGNLGAVNTLTSTINQLTADIAQNTQALTDNTAATIQANVSQITRQGQFVTGVYSGLGQIVQTLGQITGSPDIKAMIGLLQSGNQSLGATSNSLAGQLSGFASSYGVSGIPNLAGLSGAGLVQAISSMNLPAIEAQLDPAQQQVFEGIISALIANGEQVSQNTQQLAQLNGQFQQPQQWSTTVWQTFRDAIFSGMGNLLPAYQSVLPPGSAPSIAPVFSPVPNQPAPTIGELNIHHAPGTAIDPRTLGAQLAHEVATSL